MKTFRVSAEMTISLVTVVRAKSKEEALELVAARPVIGLCHQCAGGFQSEEWITSGELDGEPTKLRVD